MTSKGGTKKLSSLVGIRSGYPFRSKVKHAASGWDYYVLQLKDVQKDHHINLDHVTQVKMPDETPQTLKPGEILLRARGGYFYSGLFTADIPNVIAAGQFFVLTPKAGIVDPSYLCWYLNQPDAQLYLERNDTGSNISMINKRTVSELPVPLPSMAIQHKIASIHEGWLKEKRLTEQLLNNREQMVRGMCEEFIQQDFDNPKLRTTSREST